MMIRQTLRQPQGHHGLYCSDSIGHYSVILPTFPLVPVLLHAFHYFLCINSCGRYQLSSRIFSLKPFSSSTSPVMAATSISTSVKSECNESHTPSYYLTELARNNAAHLDKFGRG